MGTTRVWWCAGVVVFAAGCSADEGAGTSPIQNGAAGTTTGATVGGVGGATQTAVSSGGLGGPMAAATGQTAATTDGGTTTSNGSMTQGSSVGGGSSASTGNVLVSGAPVVSNLTVEPNPNSTISAYVTWTTDEPGNSEVQFGIDEVEFRIVSEALVTDHRVLVIGMYADSDYVMKALSTNTYGSGSAEGSFTTGSLPSEIPLPTLSVNEPSSSQSGWTLTNHMVGTGSGSFGSISPPVIVMYDELGVPVWYYINGDTNDSRGDISVQLTAENTIVVGPGVGEAPREVDLGGNILWEGPANGGGGDPMTHHAGKLANGNFAVIRDTSSGQLTGSSIEEYDQDNQLAWSWNLLEHTTPPSGTSGDWCHGNSVTVDLDADFVYLNCRFLGLYKVSRSSGEILWHMGGTYADDVPGDFTYSPASAQFSDAHDPEIGDDGTILFYDNGGYTGALGNTGNFHSRVLEYAIDETTHTATLIWEFPGDFPVDSWYTDTWYSPYWGDADRLENDNILVTASVKNGEVANRIFEVTREGEVVWEIISPIDVGSYRALRLSPPPLVQRIQ